MRACLAVLLIACSSSSPHGNGVDSMPGGTCGGFVAATCPTDLVCDFVKDNCGAGDQPGTCAARPTDCPDTQFIATCGCDGMIRGSVCDTLLAGVDVAATPGHCTPPDGKFACGFIFCDLATSYCEHHVATTGPDAFSCTPLPAACGSAPSCTCLAAEPCHQSCSGDATTGLTALCPA